ncbi:hypothetical protein RJ639_012781 [Escallonia herrerae]|uniref:Reverse transcriptase/retrotransposon-derived protein RNase H-like domain-containing protein n=1 Tax=Escallonia herrerae TaxID=1293975 RepID=A0AA89AQF1_9ASTE|nr:hypothetical protein RJ639_012781 [Escallonia herrerae]
MRFMELFSNLQAQIDVEKVCMEDMQQDMAMCKRSIAGEAVVTPSPRGKRQNERSLEASGLPRSSTTSFGTWSDILKVLASLRSKPSCLSTDTRLEWTLTNPLRKGKAQIGLKRCQNAFDGLKETITKQPFLALPKHAKMYKLHKDASNFAIGGVLMQEGHPIAYESHKLNDIERSDTKLLHSRGCIPVIPEGRGKVLEFASVHCERAESSHYKEVLDRVV